MLVENGIIDQKSGTKITNGLQSILTEIEKGGLILG
jgi:argininosuccinate lyase